MKHLFFVLLLALAALFFFGCSSSDSGGGNGTAPVAINGNVVIPSAYSSYVVYVCGDTDSSNSCSAGETYAKANPDGSFTVTVNANSPLVAEFYDTDPFPASGASISSLNGVNPKFVYTTPAGKTVISAFTAMIKNKTDLDPTITVNIATEAVKLASGITDPFNVASYSGSAAAAHEVVTKVAEGVLGYITGTLHKTVDTSPAVVAALYELIFQLVDTIAADPIGANANIGTLVSDAEGDIEQAIEDAEEALDDAASSGNWDLNATITLYQIGYHSDDYTMTAYQTGSIWKGYDRTPLSDLGENELPPSSGESEQFTLAEEGIVVEKAVKTSPSSIVTSWRFKSREIPLTSAGAEVYTLIGHHDYTIPGHSFDELRVKYETDNMGDNVAWYGRVTVTSIGSDTYEIEINHPATGYITMNGTDKTFRWVDTGEYDIFPSNSAFDKRGRYAHENEGTNKETYTFTADDGSVAKVFRPNSEPSILVMAVYPKVNESIVFFNAAAARDVGNWLKAYPITPTF
jgi:hypothetical protein